MNLEKKRMEDTVAQFVVISPYVHGEPEAERPWAKVSGPPEHRAQVLITRWPW